MRQASWRSVHVDELGRSLAVVPEPADALLIFDGDCGFCTQSAAWIASSWQRAARPVSWQQLGPSRLAELGLSPQSCREAAWWVDPDGTLYRGHRAIGKSLTAASGWKRLAGRLILNPAIGPIASAAYALVARYRYRLPGGSETCRVDQPGPA